MGTEIKMPQLGESVTEGTITKWLVSPGDKVNKYDPLAEVMTDKVNAEIPSSYEGIVEEIIAQEDETIAVGEVICKMKIEQESAEPKAEAESAEKEQEQSSASPEEKTDTSSKSRYSPAVMRLAQENDIELSAVQGSGRGGRITRKDLLSIISGENQSAPAPESAEKQQESREKETSEKTVESVSTPQKTDKGRTQEIPVSGVRKAIAQNMVHSKKSAPHAWMMVEVDVTNLVKLRDKIKDGFAAQEGYKLTYLPFFMKAVVDALKKYPQVNAEWADDKIIRYKDVHLSIAVATEENLYVPVIHHADEKNVKGLARSLHDITEKVKEGSLTSKDMQGGTFTLNNTGSFGSVQSQPIINAPQAAILSVESIVKKPVVLENDAIAIRNMVNLCMSLDHRVLDGLISGKFMNDIKTTLENMSGENTSVY